VDASAVREMWELAEQIASEVSTWRFPGDPHTLPGRLAVLREGAVFESKVEDSAAVLCGHLVSFATKPIGLESGKAVSESIYTRILPPAS
jgi:hypothetical protein